MCCSEQCQAIKWSDGLYLQCDRSKNQGSYCSSHKKEAEKNESGKPSHGTVEDRLAQDLFNYVYPNKPKQTPYAKIMKKYGYTREDVLAAAAEKSIEIDPRHFEGFEVEEEPKAKKVKEAKEPKEPKEPKEKKAKEPKEKKAKEPKEPKEPKEKKAKEAKPKGRPAKAKKVAEPSNDDLFATLVMQYNSDTDEAATDANAEVNTEEENAEPDVYKAFKYNGIKYYKSTRSGIVYEYNALKVDKEEIVVGTWNESDQKVDFKKDEEEDEEEEEEEEYTA